MSSEGHLPAFRRALALCRPNAVRHPSWWWARRPRRSSAITTGVLVLGLSALAAPASPAQHNGFPLLTGPYLGQLPPVKERQRFAPGIVSTEAGNHSSPAFTPDGHELYWSMRSRIWFTRRTGSGAWTEPEMLPCCKGDQYQDDNPFITPDGQKLFFTRFDAGQGKETIWYADRTSLGWADPRPVSRKVNAMRLHWSLSVSRAGTLYFQGSREDGYGKSDIYASRLVGGEYQEPVNLGPVINTAAVETCPYIAPDESYLLFNRMDERDREHSGIVISHRDEAGRWLPPVVVIGGATGLGGVSPRISPDGKYLFYVNGSEGTWWVPTASYPELRGKEREQRADEP